MYHININVGVDFCENPGDPKVRNSSVEEFLDVHLTSAWNQLLSFDGETQLVLDFSHVFETRHTKTFVQRLFYQLFQRLDCPVKKLEQINNTIIIVASSELYAQYWCGQYFEEACRRISNGRYKAKPMQSKQVKAYERKTFYRNQESF